MYLVHGRSSLLLTAAENWLPIRPNYQSDVLKDRNAAALLPFFSHFFQYMYSTSSSSMCVKTISSLIHPLSIDHRVIIETVKLSKHSGLKSRKKIRNSRKSHLCFIFALFRLMNVGLQLVMLFFPPLYLLVIICFGFFFKKLHLFKFLIWVFL